MHRHNVLHLSGYEFPVQINDRGSNDEIIVSMIDVSFERKTRNLGDMGSWLIELETTNGVYFSDWIERQLQVLNAAIAYASEYKRNIMFSGILGRTLNSNGVFVQSMDCLDMGIGTNETLHKILLRSDHVQWLRS